MKKFYLKVRKFIFALCLAIALSPSVFGVDIIVAGITYPTEANGTYTPNGLLYGYSSWKLVNGGLTFYIYNHNYMGNGELWNIDNDTDDADVYFYSTDKSTVASPANVPSWSSISGTGPLVVTEAGAPLVPEINVKGNTFTIVDGNPSPNFQYLTKYGSCDVSSGTVAKTYTIENVGTGVLTISGLTISGINASDFTVTTMPASSVASASTTSFVVTFNPSAVGTRNATINITSNDSDEGTYDFSINGFGYNPANLTVSGITNPAAANGTYTHQGVTNNFEYWKYGSYYLYNYASQWYIDNDLNSSSVLFFGADNGDNPSPLYASSWTAETGTGTAHVAAAIPEADINLQGNTVTIANNDITPSYADYSNFGSSDVSTGTVVRTFTIQNTGGATLTLSGTSPYITISGANASDFAVTAIPSASIAASTISTFQITFNPSASGTRTATVTIANNDPDEGTYTFSIQGDGFYPQSLSVSGITTPAANGVYVHQGVLNNFQYWKYGSYYIYNDGGLWHIDTDLSNASVLFDASNNGQAASPTAVTSWSPYGGVGTPVITVYAPEINIQGNSTSIVDGSLTSSTANYTDFALANVTSGTVVRTFTIQNTGTSALSLTGSSPYVTISGTNAADFSVTAIPSASIATSGSTTFQVTFDPSATGTRSATISIANNDADENPYDFAIQGTGIAAPTITTSAAATITTTSATLGGNISSDGNNAVTARGIVYSTSDNTPTIGELGVTQDANGSGTGNFSKSISSLTVNTTYYFQAYAINTAGTSYGGILSFTTSGIAPTATTGTANSVTSTGATLNGTVNANNASTTVTFEYGLTTGYGSSATSDQSPVTGTSNTSVSKAITGLTPNTTYHFSVKGVNTAGTTNGLDQTFTTSAVVPTATTNAAGSVTSTGATLNGTVNANNASTTVTFEYGLTTGYGTSVTADQSPVTGTSNTSVSKAITGLTSNTTYHFRVKGVNTAGTTNGLDQTFTTNAVVPTATTQAAGSITSTGATLNGTINANNASTTVTFEYGLTTGYGSSATADQSPVTGTSNTSVSKAVTGLTPNTTYHFRVKGVNTAGTTNALDQTFTTNAVVPTATTNAASSVSSTGATLNGTVNANNASSTVTFEYGLTTGYGSSATSDQSPVTGTSNTSVTKAITGLTPNTTYHFRVKGVNTAGTTNGLDQTFTTSAVVPTVTTNAAGSVTSTGATLNGTINANNASTTVTFEYGLTTGYGSSATADQSPVTGTSNTSVSKAITGLTSNTTYHFRVKGVNTAGTTNALDQTFTTSAVVPTATTDAAGSVASTGATLNGTVNANNASTTVNFEYGLTTGYGTSVTADQSPVTGTSNTSVSKAITGLTPNTTYHFRVKGVNTAGTANGLDQTFTTSAVVPTVTTQAVSSITSTTATGNGNITSLGVPNPTAYGVCWNATGTPTISDSKVDKGAASVTGAFTASLTSLTANTTYYVRAFATNTAGTSYGTEVFFTTSAIAPTVTTQAVSAITSTTATGNGNITSLGVPNPTAYGVCWNTTGTPTTSDGKVDNGAASATGAFTASITSLTANTTYYVRSFATNIAGTSYGGTVSFTTLTPEINITGNSVSIVDGDITPSATDHTDFGSTAVAGGTVVRTFTIQNTGTSVLSLTGISPYVTISGTNAADFDVTAAPSSSIAASGSTTFQVTFDPSSPGLRTASISIDNDDSNENPYNFDIQGTGVGVDAPTLTTTAATSITINSATLGGDITADGGAAVTERGIVFSTTDNTPTIGEAGVTKDDNGTGSGIFSESISSLTPGAVYYVQAYATNSAGTNYGGVLSFTTIQTQTITFSSLASVTYGDTPFNLTASSSSGLPVSYVSSDPLVATVSGSSVTIVGIGSTIITASQPGDNTFVAAENVQKTLTVNPKALTIAGTFTVSDKPFDGTKTAVINTNNLSLTGVITGDEVGFTVVVAFSQSTAGANIPVNIISAELTGADKGNYTITVDNSPTAAAAITPGTDVPEISKGNLILYPNPFADNVFFSNSNDISHITIQNMFGQKVIETNTLGKKSIPTGQLVNGVYLITIEDKNGAKQVFKMVKKD